jgi:hypothetical protein
MPPPSTQSNRREEELLSSITPEESKKILPAPIPLFAWVSRASYSFETPGSLHRPRIHGLRTWTRRNESSRRFPAQPVSSFKRFFQQLGTSSKASPWILNEWFHTTKQEKVRHTLWEPLGVVGLARRKNGGRGGIRTPGWISPSPDFESGTLNRAQPPFRASKAGALPKGRTFVPSR